MTKGRGLPDFEKLLAEKLLKENHGVRVGSGLFDHLVRANRITMEQWHVVGMPSAGAVLPTLDKKYFVERHPFLDDEEFEMAHTS